MNTKKDITTAAKLINKYKQIHNEIISPEVYIELRQYVDDDMLLYLGCQLVKQPVKTFFEYPLKYIEDEKVESVCLLHAVDSTGEVKK